MKDAFLRHKTWILRILVLVLCGFMLLSFILPWWTADVSVIKTPGAIRLYGWGLRHELTQYPQFISQDETPQYQTVLAWCYMALSILLLWLSTWLKGKKGAVLTVVVGLGYLAYTMTALFGVITPRLEEAELVLQGSVFKTILVRSVLITSSLRWGYYLACAAAAVCTLLGFIRLIPALCKPLSQCIAPSSKAN
jgi:hypothetical protein